MSGVDGISALYLHVPFCASRCRYCDFTTCAVPPDDPLLDDYAMALSLLVRRASMAGLLGGIETIYLGGGTPSYLGHRRLLSLVTLITTRIDVGYDTEFTLEANPDSLDERMVADLWSLGVNRWSLGVQSFDDDVLNILGRRHDAAGARRAIDILARRDANFSIDLMCGIPGQSAASWRSSLEEAVSCGAKHASVYPLTIEEGTPFSRDVASGRMERPDDDAEADMMMTASDVLESAGFSRYEVASYAKPGCASRHNEAYWTGKQYLGLGTAAASMVSPELFEALVDAGIVEEETSGDKDVAVVRMTAAQDAREFARAVMDGRPMKVVCERLSIVEHAAESLMLRMRMTSGVTLAEVEEASSILPGIGAVFSHLVDEGLVTVADGPSPGAVADSGSWSDTAGFAGDPQPPDGPRYVPTQRGWLLGNVMFGEIWDARGQGC